MAGGMLRVGIPAHRLPREVLNLEIEVITDAGRRNQDRDTVSGKDVTIDELFKKDGYKAVYPGHRGLHRRPSSSGSRARTPTGVRQGVDFLREANLTGKTAEVGRKVADHRRRQRGHRRRALGHAPGRRRR
ncbi:MAG: hypothetical protein MZV70_44700 [Desulfobacterales bacterium]|nr:hypothetical protein [Desulfobacterales bacterium]